MTSLEKKQTDTALASLLAKQRSDHTRAAYEGDWRRYTTWCKKQKLDFLKVKPRHVEDYLTHLQQKGGRDGQGAAGASIGRALSSIREVYGAFVRDEIMETNPAREVKPPRVDRTPRTPWMTPEQLKILLNTPPTDTWEGRRDRLVLRLLAGLGWRRAEIAHMKVEDFENRTVKGIGKGRKKMHVGVPEWLEGEIAHWQSFAGIQTGWLLPWSEEELSKVDDAHQNSITGPKVYNIVKKWGAEAKLPSALCKPHAMRRTFTTILYQRGTDLREIQDALSHSSVTTTERYQKAALGATRAPGEALADLANNK